MEVRVIRNEADHEAAIRRLGALMEAAPRAGSAKADELELLAVVIEDYERRLIPPPVVDPVEAILFRLDQMGLTRADLVPYLGSPSRVSEVLARRRPLSISMIRRLHEGLGVPAEPLIASALPRQVSRSARERSVTRVGPGTRTEPRIKTTSGSPKRSVIRETVAPRRRA